MQTYYTVHIDSVLPPLSETTWLVPWETPLCEVCGFRRQYLRSDLQYEAEKLDNAKDFNVTMEHINNYDIPQIVISARARNAFLQAKHRPYYFARPVTLITK